MSPTGQPLSRADVGIGASLAAVSLAVLLATVEGVGCTRDEGYYFRAADLYLAWMEGAWRNLWQGRLADSLTDAAIVPYWSYNWEHPVLLKALFGLSWKLFHDELGWLSDSTAYRLPGMLLAAAMVALVYLFGAEWHGRRVGLVAAGMVATIPRLFHDAHLACFDVGIATLHLVVLYAYWKGLRSVPWALVTGVAFGLALATKLNAFFLPLILATHAALSAWRHRGARVPRALPVVMFLAMATLGLPLFFLHWPYLWHDPVARIGAYLRFHLQHVHYPVEYFGRVLSEPPFPTEFVVVMTWVTVPLATVVLMTIAVGRGVVLEAAMTAGRGVRDDPPDRRDTRLLLLLGGMVPIVVIALPGVPVFGGVKHWFTSMPCLALLAAAELDRLLVWAGRGLSWRPRAGGAAYAAIVGAVIAPGALGIHLVHPYGIGFYNEVIGGVRGAAEKGMMRNFWGHTSRGTLSFLNERVEPGGRVFFHRTNPECYASYVREGVLRPDIVYAYTLEDADWATFHHQRPHAADEYRIWSEWGSTRPEAGVYVDEVPMNLVYRRTRSDAR
ncbi:MAG TPA: glycosyltransferase family 39 protein [Vicinamibacteria bacterium]|nr:glycosyltransferase family 39 protein [Vicinamibacteria bacterium]